MISKKLPIMILLLLVLPFVSANLVMDVEPHQNRIFPHQEANFSVHVKNTGDNEETVTYFFPSNPGWSIITNPISSKKTIASGENFTTYVRVMPVEERLIPKKYEIPFTITSSSTGEKYRDVFKIYLRNPSSYRNYVPIVNIDVDVQEEVVPTEKATIKLILHNRNRLNITDFTFRVNTSVNDQNDQVIKMNLPPNGDAQEEIELSYPPKISPTTDEITISPSIPSHNRTYDTIYKEVKIKGYTDVKTEEDISKSFLKTTETYTFTNNGNVPAERTKSISSGAFKELFTSASPDYNEVNTQGYKYLEWDIEIAPSETKQIHLTVNYRPLFIVIVLVIIALAVYYLERSPVVIKKEAKKIPGFEGETSRLKVLLHIKNRTNKPIENLNVVDTIPKIAQFGKKHTLGTMQPSKVINHEKKGTIIKWNIPVLEAYEERIISYQIYSKLEIIGPMKLAKAILKYKNKRGRNSRVFSNNVLSA